jgi:DNA-binding transcriptional LysR family regulator
MFAPELKANKVRPVLADWSLPPLEVWAIFPIRRQAGEKARAFADFFKNQMSGRDLAQIIERIVSSRSEC